MASWLRRTRQERLHSDRAWSAAIAAKRCESRVASHAGASVIREQPPRRLCGRWCAGGKHEAI